MRRLLISFCVLIGIYSLSPLPAIGRVRIINGVFFEKSPSGLKSSGSDDRMSFSVGTVNDVSAFCTYDPGITLTEEMMTTAIPVDEVEEGHELLRRYEDQIKRSKNRRIPATPGPQIRVGDRFPKFSATDVDGHVWTNADVEGKVMVLNLWFTGCGPCRAEMPELSEWKDEMPDVMFFSSTYESPEVARQVLDKGIFNWIPLVNDRQFCDFLGDRGYPFNVVVDKTGHVVAVVPGTSIEKRESLKRAIMSVR